MGCVIEFKYLWLIKAIMTDTPEHIKKIQLEIWLAKTPEERLTQFLTDNDIMFKAIIQAKKDLGIAYNPLEEYRK